jgi:hypothetical protein
VPAPDEFVRHCTAQTTGRAGDDDYFFTGHN